MPADIVADQLTYSSGVESLVLMDDYGHILIVDILLTQSDVRAATISGAQAAMTTKQQMAVDYATAASLPLPPSLTLQEKYTLYSTLGFKITPVTQAAPTVPASTTPASTTTTTTTPSA